MIKLFVPILMIFCQIGFAQNDSLIQLERLDQDDPTIILFGEYEHSYITDLNTALAISESLSDSIAYLFYSVDYYLSKDECLKTDLKNTLIQDYDSLEVGWEMFLESTNHIEKLSYGRGHVGGLRSINMTIRFQRNFLEYLKFWANSLYYVFLESGVVPCE